jgi:hypothetical protein
MRPLPATTITFTPLKVLTSHQLDSGLIPVGDLAVQVAYPEAAEEVNTL